MENRPLFRQLFDCETCTYTYLLADPLTREAVLIDPVLEKVDRDARLLDELGLELTHVLETHVHADHVTGAALLGERTGAKTVVGAATGVTQADRLIGDGEALRFGGITLTALATPGHTDGCTSYLCGDRVFTGDALLIRGNGRTDFQQGSAEKLFDSIMGKLYPLHPATHVYPAHDYNGICSSTIGEEMTYNKRIPAGQSKEAFVRLMAELHLPEPKKLAIAVPANLTCGKVRAA